MNKKTKIITHHGKAHFDDFCAVALILGKFPNENFLIERREPTQEEIDDKNVWVVDIGCVYDVEKKNFDHHQDLNIPASFVLIANYLNVTRKLKKTMTWWDFKDYMDRFGPMKTGKKFSVDNVSVTFSPIEYWILKLFEDDPMKHYDIIKQFGVSLLEKASKLEERLNFWEKESNTVFVSGKKVIVGLTKDIIGLKLYRDKFMKEPASVAICYDNRGSGWKLIRFNDYENINFFNVHKNKNIFFAHKGGFTAKTKTLIPIEEVLEIIKEAIK